MIRSLVATALLVAPTIALAQAPSPPLVGGTVTKVDSAAEKITLRHDAIPNLDMGEMTGMVFKAGEKAMLSEVKAGDKVQFTADRVNGQLTITSIRKAAPAPVTTTRGR